MFVSLGADHRGYFAKAELIDWLKGRGIEYKDFGNTKFDHEDDYNDFAKAVVGDLLAYPADDHLGILICGSAQGMAMQANRYKGIRAALCYNADVAKQARYHNAANVLCLPADDQPDLIGIATAFLETAPLSDERFRRRNEKLDEI